MRTAQWLGRLEFRMRNKKQVSSWRLMQEEARDAPGQAQQDSQRAVPLPEAEFSSLWDTGQSGSLLFK